MQTIVGRRVILEKVPDDWQYITDEIKEAEGRVFTALSVDVDGDVQIDLPGFGYNSHFVPINCLTVVTTYADLED
jgi:hypothetical protein